MKNENENSQHDHIDKDQQTHQDDVMVHQEHVTHIENNNGKSVRVEQKEEKVLDTDSGKVLADVKQQKQTDFSAGDSSAPQTVVQTNVDIPSAGVHQTFVQDDEQPSEGSEDVADDVVDSENEDEPDLTPADMAAYLYETQQFEAFYAAMDRLVNESKMSPEDAEAYAKTVAMEYERLQLQDLEERYIIERRSYPQSLPENDFYGALPAYDVAVPEASDSNFDMLSYINSLMTPEEQYLAQRQAQNEADLIPADTIDPYQFVAALWNEAYEQGNEEAQEIVRLLYDRVSHDSNPDDMGEIRDILLDTVAQSLGEDTPYAFDTPMDTPLAMPQMPVSQEGAGLDNPESVANNSEESEAEEAETEGENNDEEEEEEVEEEAGAKDATKEEDKSVEEKDEGEKEDAEKQEQAEEKH
ncbi:hypothetical protein RRG08_004861 [Elysia crispata]|uniref:Uncharacterized protein n=1 Tax=Elysia crispata TaxID=231223 RepID=A0AAE1DI48_9GAST|nr:hypothetical protein RRG08_004861 [Elysia crispata]